LEKIGRKLQQKNTVIMNKEKIKELTLKLIFSKENSTFIFKLSGMFLNFFVTLLITNYFGGSSYGLFSLALTFQQFLVMFFSLGIPSAFIAFTGEFNSEKQNKGFLVKSYKISFLIGIIPILLLYFGAIHVANFYGKPDFEIYLKIAITFLLVAVFHEININYLLSVRKIKWYGVFYFLLPNFLFLLLILLFYNLLLPNHYVMLAYGLSILATVLLSLYLIFKNREIEKTAIKTKAILTKSIPMMLSGFFLILLNWTDVLMLGKFESERNIGIYNASFKLGYLTLFFVTAMGALIIADVAKFYTVKDFGMLKKIINKATQLTIFFTLPVALTLIFFSEYLLGFFGSEFKEGRIALILITLGAFFNAATGNVDQILNMTGNEKKVIQVMVVGFLFNVALNFLLIPKYGYEGAALSSFLVNVIVNTIFVFVIRKRLGFYTFI
jgi:O-antigen/teichoic acid export membrane protein